MSDDELRLRKALHKRTPLYDDDDGAGRGYLLTGELVSQFSDTCESLRTLALVWSGVGAELREDDFARFAPRLASLRGCLLDAIDHANALQDAMERASDERRERDMRAALETSEVADD